LLFNPLALNGLPISLHTKRCMLTTQYANARDANLPAQQRQLECHGRQSPTTRPNFELRMSQSLAGPEHAK
jgi:hypothetical protein